MATRLRSRWERLSVLERGLIVGGAGLSVGILFGYLAELRRRIRLDGPYTPGRPGQDLPSILDLLDYDEEEVDEAPPADLEYADDLGPCPPPPKPWDVPVASMEAMDADAEGCVPPAELEPLKRTEVAFATGADRPRWPLATDDPRKLQVSYQDVRKLWHGRWGREFGASRKGKDVERLHSGIDLFADDGDVVLATEPGEIIATLPFYKGTGALYQLTDSGLIINYGEIEHGSWKDFGIPTGVGLSHRVKAGDPIARVGVNNTAKHSSMLHMEIYEDGVTIDEIRQGAMQWAKSDPPPMYLLDPTRYLVRAQRVKSEEMA